MTTVFTNLTAFLDSFIDMGIPGYDCIIMRHGEPIYRHSNGFQDIEKKHPINGQEIYSIFSCSKPITVTAALQLLDKGLYKLDDPICNYMPEFTDMTVRLPDGSLVPANRPITIRHLFTMTAGLAYTMGTPNILQGKADTNGKCPTREMMKYIAKDPLQFQPGERWAYSLCHDILAAFVEVLTGQLFNDYVTGHIFEPLGMDHSTFLPTQEQYAKVLTLYKTNEQGVIVPFSQFPNCNEFSNPYRLGEEYASGGAGCISTLHDYIAFLEALRIGDVILSKETTKQMAADQLLAPQREGVPILPENYSYGLGVRCHKDGSALTDYGWGGAAGAYLGVDPVRDYTFFYVQHVLSSPKHELRDSIPAIINEELEK